MADKPLYPTVNFHFRVDFNFGSPTKDIAFQSVTGLDSTLETEEVKEGGENRFTHVIPVRRKYGPLTFWRRILNCEGHCDELPCEEEPPCEPNMECCELEPMMTFPIDQDPYFLELKDLTEAVKIKMHELKHESDEANELQASLQACLDGLNTALKASAPGTRCGN